jgi:hypothetical protein
MSFDDTQDESQPSPSLQRSPPKYISQSRQRNVYRTPDRLNWLQTGLDDTQDESQSSPHKHSPFTRSHGQSPFHITRITSHSKNDVDDTQDLTQESEHDIPPARKRKREPTIYEIPDSAPLDDTFSPGQSRKRLELDVLDDSLVILSQAPTRKKPPEIINIHSTQSQTQEYDPPPGPRPTSQDLSKPFGRTNSDESSSSSLHIHQSSHRWESSQVTQSPVSAPVELGSFANPPSQLDLSSQNDLSRVPVPLALTLECEFLTRGFSHLPDLDKMEEEQERDLRKWEEEKYTPKSRRK